MLIQAYLGALDDSNKHRLSAMTKAGLHHLIDLQHSDNKADNGFFMLIEAAKLIGQAMVMILVTQWPKWMI